MPQDSLFYASAFNTSHFDLSKRCLIHPHLDKIEIVDVVKDGKWGPHRPSIYEAIIVAEGTYEMEINNKVLTFKPGEGIILRPKNIHTDICHAESRLLIMRFHFGFSWGENDNPIELFSPDSRVTDQRFTCDVNTIEMLFQDAIDNPSKRLLNAQLHQAKLLAAYYEILTSFKPADLDPNFIAGSKDEEFSASLHSYLSKHLHCNINVDDVADAMGMSRSSLSHKCRDMIGESVTGILRNMRLSAAKDMLENSDIAIKEIALKVGFRDPYHFSKSFKTHFGTPPNHLRK